MILFEGLSSYDYSLYFRAVDVALMMSCTPIDFGLHGFLQHCSYTLKPVLRLEASLLLSYCLCLKSPEYQVLLSLLAFVASYLDFILGVIEDFTAIKLFCFCIGLYRLV